jgi:diphthine methyl ester acylhydrolase
MLKHSCNLCTQRAFATGVLCCQRSLVHQRTLAQVDLGGGVWRFRWHPTNPDCALVACMQNGFAIVRVQADGSLVRHFEYQHQKVLGYGASWCQEGDGIVATCSFYDRSVHIWQAPMQEMAPAC